MTYNSPNYNIEESPGPYSENESLDIKRYLSLIISNWYWFAVSLLIAMSIAYGINRWSEEVYTVSSTILVKDESNTALTNIFPSSGSYRGQQNLNNEIGILKSFNLNSRVMEELPDFYINYIKVGKRGIAETRMYQSAPFIVIYESINRQKPFQQIDIRIIDDKKYRLTIDGDKNFEKELQFGEHFNDMGFDFRIELRDKDRFRFDPKNSNKYYFYFVTNSYLANLYRSSLSINPTLEESSLMTLRTSGYVPEQEATYLNTLMEKYLEFGLEYKNKTVEQTLIFIDEQLAKISDSLKIAERNLEMFKLSNKILEISYEGTQIRDKLEKIDQERTNLLIQKKYIEYLKEYISSKQETEEIIAPAVMGVADQQLINLVSDLSEKQLQRRQFTMNINEVTDASKLLSSEIELLRRAIDENLNDKLKIVVGTIEEKDIEIRSLWRELMKLPVTERQLINIQRNYDINNTVYTYLLEKRAEAGIARASNASDNRIIDRAGASMTNKIKPKDKQNQLFAVIFGLAFPFILIMIIDFLNNKIIDRKDVEKLTKVPIVGYISHNSMNSELPVIEKTGSTLAESFRSVRTNLKYFVKDLKNPVIAVSSTITAEGKTFISANLASIFAISGKKVLLIGLDLRKPRIHRLLGKSNESGLSNFLIGQEAFEDVISKTEVENLWYATAGPVPPNPSELIDSSKMFEFINKAKAEFDIIIIDTPPVGIVTDALLCASFTDVYIFVVRQRYSSKNTLELIDELHKSRNIKNMGIIINDISLSGYYGYGLRYGSYLGYGYSYGYNYYGSYADRMYGYKGSSDKYYTED